MIVHQTLLAWRIISRVVSHFRRSIHGGILKVSDEVKAALHDGKPVVALESTIITHGMPFPENMETALAVEATVRRNGSIPATVAIFDGKIHVGLNQSELEKLAANSDDAIKTSRRDLSYVLSQGLTGGTTVSGTMVAAHMAKIPIFVTGGIGGVHRGAESSLDISADLTELGRTPMTVVSAGAKSILDIGRTLEFLETQGVCVASFGPTLDFPAFFTPRSGFLSPYNVNSAEEAAKLIESQSEIGLQSGILIAVPIPEDYAESGEIINTAILQAVSEAEKEGVTGKAVTPYLLKRVNELTAGVALKSNIALVLNNATIGSKIAVELSKLRERKQKSIADNGSNRRVRQRSDRHSTRIVVIGASNVDFYAKAKDRSFKADGFTYPGKLSQSMGGVGRNIADCLSHLHMDPLFISAVGVDGRQKFMEDYCQHMDLSGVARLPQHSTATYCAVLDSGGDLKVAIGDMDINQEIDVKHITQYADQITRAPLVCLDGNISTEAIEFVCDLCQGNNVPVWFEPTDVYKSTKPFSNSSKKGITYASPNLAELKAIHSALLGNGQIQIEDDSDLPNFLQDVAGICRDITEYIPILVVTLGKHGIILCRSISDSSLFPVKGCKMTMAKMSAVHYSASADRHAVTDIVSVSGAGDCLAASMISGILQGHNADICIKFGLLGAQHSLRSQHTVPSSISPATVSMEMVSKWTKWNPTVIISNRS